MTSKKIYKEKNQCDLVTEWIGENRIRKLSKPGFQPGVESGKAARAWEKSQVYNYHFGAIQIVQRVTLINCVARNITLLKKQVVFKKAVTIPIARIIDLF